MPTLILRRAQLPGLTGTSDIEIVGGRIRTVGTVAATAAHEIDCAGRVVIPGLVEPHVHLDKAHLDLHADTLGEAIALTAAAKRGFTAAGVRDRARRVLDQAIGNGTTLIRAHPDVDPVIGLLGVTVLLGLREEYRDLIDLQIVAFPQEGILRAPGTLALLREALEAGADVVGGCSYQEADVRDCRRHVDLVLELAAEYGVPADLHADFADDTGDPRYAMAGYIAEATERAGLGGRVTLGHVTSLAARGDRAAVIARLAGAGVAVVPLPATDLHLGGRDDGRRAIAPVRELWDGGVTTAYSSNNIRNAFTPTGRADPLDIGLLLVRTCHLAGDADLARVLAMATTEAARVVGVAATYGVREGADADLVVLGTTDPATILLDQPDRAYVLKRGRIVATTDRTTELRK